MYELCSALSDEAQVIIAALKSDAPMTKEPINACINIIAYAVSNSLTVPPLTASELKFIKPDSESMKTIVQGHLEMLKNGGKVDWRPLIAYLIQLLNMFISRLPGKHNGI